MAGSFRILDAAPIVGQAALALSALLILALYPPRSGPMIVIPLGPSSSAWLLKDGVKLIGSGPLPGSLIVTGQRSALLPLALDHGSLLLAAPHRWCESGAKERARNG